MEYYTVVSQNHNFFIIIIPTFFPQENLSIDLRSVQEGLESLPFWMKPVIQESWKLRSYIHKEKIIYFYNFI